MAAADNPHVKAKAAAADDDEHQADSDQVTHDLYLADGSCVESAGAIPTHIAVGDRVIPVIRAIERQEPWAR